MMAMIPFNLWNLIRTIQSCGINVKVEMGVVCICALQMNLTTNAQCDELLRKLSNRELLLL